MNEMPMNIEELRAALDKLSNELNLADHSISNRCKDNASVTIGDLHFLNELDNLESHLDCLLREGAQLKYDITHGYCQWITRHRKVLLPDELDNKTIYSLYLYTQRAAGVGINAQNLEPASGITYAIDALCDLTPPLCHERDICTIPTSIEFKDGTKLLFHRFKLLFNRFNVSGGLEDATSSDDVAGFCLGMDIRGKQLSRTLLRCLMRKRCVNILTHVIRTYKKLPSACPPEILLLIALYEMDGCPLLPVIKAIEETFPGTIKSAEDASHRNALWYTLRHHIKVLNVHNVNFCCATDIENVEQYLLSKGCDPTKASNDRFSWQAMKRVINAIQHFETNGLIE